MKKCRSTCKGERRERKEKEQNEFALQQVRSLPDDLILSASLSAQRRLMYLSIQLPEPVTSPKKPAYDPPTTVSIPILLSLSLFLLLPLFTLFLSLSFTILSLSLIVTFIRIHTFGPSYNMIVRSGTRK